MSARAFYPDRFLRSVYGTESFADYCRERQIPFQQRRSALRREDVGRWLRTLSALPGPARERIERELAQVNELADPRALAQLTEATHRHDLPSDLIPGNAALALWFFLHHPDLFQEVFFTHEIEEFDSWRVTQAPLGVVLVDLPTRQAALAESLMEFFRVREGTGRFCCVDACRLREAYCFLARVSNRLQFLEVFTEQGRYVVQRVRPAFSVLFTYHPADGRVRLQVQERNAGKILDLFQRFGRTVLGVELNQRRKPAFRLDLFKQPFAPLPDADDMEMVRVRTLHLVYPERSGRRRVKLETLSGDSQFAILDLLREHGGEQRALDHLEVLYAELQITLREDGRPRQCIVRLWPDRCSIDHSPLGERLHACLLRWGVYVG